MEKILPGTVVHYDEIGRLITHFGSRLSGSRAAVNAHVGGQFFFSPHSMVLEAHVHHTLNHTSLLGYLANLAGERNVSLSTLISAFRTERGFFINLDDAYRDLWKTTYPQSPTFEDFLQKRSEEKIGSTGYLDHCHGQEESLCLMRNYFLNLGLPVGRGQVVMGTGFKNLFNTFLTALMTEEVSLDSRGRDFRKQGSGTILVPRGHYQSLVKAPSFHNSKLKVIEKIDGPHISEALESRGDIKAVYFSVVANPSGDIMAEEQIRDIAETVLRYNSEHKDNPLYVIADQVYNGSLLKEDLEIFSIASIANDLGRMFDYTVTIVSPSKTLGYASARIGFACSGITLKGNRENLISRMGHILGHEGSDGVEVSTETGAVAAYAFSSREWIDGNSSYIKQQLIKARNHIDSLNDYLGQKYVEINDPDAGWYILTKIFRDKLPEAVKGSEDLMVFLMNYNFGKGDTGIICRPGSQFGYEAPELPPQEYLILRSTLAMTGENLDEFFRRYRQAFTKLAALKEVGLLTVEDIDELRTEDEHRRAFCRRLESDLMMGERLPDLESLISPEKESESICADLKKYTYRELLSILER